MKSLKLNQYKLSSVRGWIGIIILLAGLLAIASLLPEELSLQRKIAAFFAALAMVAMALTFLLATRSHFLESLFGGLDKMYHVHRISGLVAVAGIFIHWMLVPQAEGGSQNDWSIAEIGSDTGEWALWLLLALVIISFAGFVPYRFWKWTHKLMGLVFIISVVHFILAIKPFGLFSAAGIAMLITSVIGIWAWVYYAFGFARSTKSLARVRNIQHWDDHVEFDVRPISRDVSWNAGQFAFISFLKNKHISSEAHPFTISSAPDDGDKLHSNSPRFSINALGDYTRQLKQNIKDKDLILLDMPYGRFTVPDNLHQQIWIGAGIGVTPFLAWLSARFVGENTAQIHFYYCVKNAAAGFYDKEIREQVNQLDHFNYELICSENVRLTAAKIYQDVGEDLSAAHVFFCGATPMREALQAGLIEKGLKRSNFHYELFDFRSAL